MELVELGVVYNLHIHRVCAYFSVVVVSGLLFVAEHRDTRDVLVCTLVSGDAKNSHIQHAHDSQR